MEKQHSFCRAKLWLKSVLESFEGTNEKVDTDFVIFFFIVDFVYLAFLKVLGKGCLKKGFSRKLSCRGPTENLLLIKVWLKDKKQVGKKQAVFTVLVIPQ